MKVQVYRIGNSETYKELGFSVFHWGEAKMFGADLYLLFTNVRINITY